MTTREAAALKCKLCKVRKPMESPEEGVMIPIEGVDGKCTHGGGLCEEVRNAILGEILKCRLTGDQELTLLEDLETMVGCPWPFTAGTVFNLIARDHSLGHVILGMGGQRILVPLPEFDQIFELL